MDGDAVHALAARFRSPSMVGAYLVRPNDWVVEDPAALIKPGPTADKLAVYSLGAVRDYLEENRDALALGELIVHVVSPQIVRISGKIQDRARQRETFVEATATNLTDNFLGKFLTIEEFIIGLQTRFETSADLRAVLRLFGTVKHEGVKTLADDGVSQSVTAKAGIALVNEAPVPNPVTLTPFRTFREVAQPPSLFVLRATGATTGTVTAGLFEADGGAWRLEAINRVAGWLRSYVPTDVAVLA